MKAEALSGEEQRATGRGFTHLLDISYTDVNTQTGLVYSFPIVPRGGYLLPGWVVASVAGRLVTPFVGTGVTALGIDIGDAGTNANSSRFLNGQSLLAGAAIYFVGSNMPLQPYNAADNFISLKFTAVGANLNLLTAGRVQLFLSMFDLNSISKP